MTAQVTGFELMFHVSFGLDAPARNYRDLLKSDKAMYVRFAHALLKRGVRVLERGAWFVSFVHDDAVIDATLDAVRDAVFLRESSKRLQIHFRVNLRCLR